MPEPQFAPIYDIEFTVPDSSTDPVTFPTTFTTCGSYTDPTFSQTARVTCSFNGGAAVNADVGYANAASMGIGTWQATMTVPAGTGTLTANLYVTNSSTAPDATSSRLNVTASDQPPVKIGPPHSPGVFGKLRALLRALWPGSPGRGKTLNYTGPFSAAHEHRECRLTNGDRRKDKLSDQEPSTAGSLWNAKFSNLSVTGKWVAVIKLLRGGRVFGLASRQEKL